ncbi:APC family permease [Psychroserpens damuponensis]|uniref:APC family permease n=1 Tax=Psychroserpens damuponensis TaxID=943936 RepID=UPI00058CA1FE|nr:APC family permease [Psychroserpens damuponensis]
MSDQISLKSAISIGIGGMVGGGIFAVLGLAVSLSKGATPLAFLFAGIVALITSYSYVKLTLSFPDNGGTVKYINEGFGKTIFSGSINNLLWISYIIMLSLYASAFGSYAPNLLELTGNTNIDTHIYSSAIVIVATIINYYSVKVVSTIESYSVAIKLIILLAFIVIGIYGLFGNANLPQLSAKNWETPLQILTAGMVIFVAYEGFELIANAGSNIINPKVNIPKAYYYSVGFVILLYIIISIVTVGSLSFETIKSAEEYVLAEAAKPMLGQLGFTVMTIAALISTFSAINASLYGGSRVSFQIAEDDELPHELTGKLWNQPIGLIITAMATLILVNFLKLESISTAGSVGFLIIFAVVNYVGFKLSKHINAKRWIPLIGCILCMLSLIVLIIKQFESNQTGVIVALAIVIFCFIIEYLYKTTEKRKAS